jgi:membrane protease YdiL (CAAX protease family)
MPMTLEEGAAASNESRPALSAFRVTLRWLELWGWIAVLLLGTIPIAMLLGGAIAPKIDEARLIPIVLWGLIAACLATRLVARRDGFTWPEIGLRRERVARDTLLGLAIGVATFALVIVMAAPFGWVTVSLTPPSAELGLSLVLTALFLLLAGAFEEITNRGLPFALLAPRGARTSILVTSAAFAAFHLPNPGIDVIGVLGVFAAGLALGIARHRSGALWLPIGWHLGWNLAQGAIFGCPVSGLAPVSAPLLPARLEGPRLLVGGAFGPESGLLAIVADLVAVVLYVRLGRPR